MSIAILHSKWIEKNDTSVICKLNCYLCKIMRNISAFIVVSLHPISGAFSSFLEPWNKREKKSYAFRTLRDSSENDKRIDKRPRKSALRFAKMRVIMYDGSSLSPKAREKERETDPILSSTGNSILVEARGESSVEPSIIGREWRGDGRAGARRRCPKMNEARFAAAARRSAALGGAARQSRTSRRRFRVSWRSSRAPREGTRGYVRLCV